MSTEVLTNFLSFLLQPVFLDLVEMQDQYQRYKGHEQYSKFQRFISHQILIKNKFQNVISLITTDLRSIIINKTNTFILPQRLVLLQRIVNIR